MTLRTRLRRWLGVENDLWNIESVQTALSGQAQCIGTLRSEHDGLVVSLNNTSKGHRELIDDALKACVALRKDLGSSAADCVAMYDAAKREYGSITQALTAQEQMFSQRIENFRKEYEAYRKTFFERMSKAEGDLGVLYAGTDRMDAFMSTQTQMNTNLEGEIKSLERLAGQEGFVVNDRLVALETASKSLGAHLALIADNATAAERARCALRIETAALPHFRREHRDKLATLIRSGK